MSDRARAKVLLAFLAVTGLVAGCAAVGADSIAASTVRESGGGPRPDIWVTYDPIGVESTQEPQGENVVVSVGSYRSPIVSLRRVAAPRRGFLEANMRNPAGFDRREVEADEVERERSEDPGGTLERALMHHRPTVRFGVDGQGALRRHDEAHLARHDRCALRRLRGHIEEEIAASTSDNDRRILRERLKEETTARIAPPVENAALLLRLAGLALPETSQHQALKEVTEEFAELSGQDAWRAQQIRSRGRHVRLELDLLTAGNTPAAKVCRSLAYRERWTLRKDRCTISGVVDRRDGWPIIIYATRDAEAENKATESVSRSFRRLTPLEGFVPPANPCPAGG